MLNLAGRSKLMQLHYMGLKMEKSGQFDLKEIVSALSLIIDQQAAGNLYHGLRVAVIAFRIGELSGFVSKEKIFYEGLLHDIGLFETGEHIIPKYLELDAQKAKRVIFSHPKIGSEIIREIPGMESAQSSILEHHEFFGGMGYPLGKRGNEISRAAQILRIADAFDIFVRMHPEFDRDELARFIENGSKREYSPEISTCLLNIDNNGFTSIWREDDLKSNFARLDKEISYPLVDITEDVREVVLKILCRAIDGKHSYTNQHSYRVAYFSFRMAQNMSLPEVECQRIRFAGYLHDIGKIAIPNSILDKPGPLTDDEWKVMRTHAAISYEIVNAVGYFRDFSEVVFAAQEEYDGSGYPKGLKEEAIPLGARIIAVADALDAMLSDRSYRRALSPEVAISELRKNSGTQFDPAAVDSALKLVDEIIFPAASF